MKKLYFFSGLPRSGFTLLGSILSQNSQFYISPISPLPDLLYGIDDGLTKLDLQYTYDKNNATKNVYTSILYNFYNHIDKPYILDKHPGWCKNVFSLEKFLNNELKVIVTTRRISEILASYINLFERNQKNEIIDYQLMMQGKQITIDNRVEFLWKNYLSDLYESLIFGLRYKFENIHLIDYNDLIENPKDELNKIYKFLNIDSYDHDLSNILNICAEDKSNFWYIGNSEIRSKLQKNSPLPEEVIGEENVKLYDLFNINL